MATGAAGGNTLESFLSELKEGEITLQYLKNITNRFAKEKELGTGTQGTIYKGILKDGSVIAVKRHWAEEPGKVLKEAYSNKIRSIMKHKHKNLVKLLAFCHEEATQKVMSEDGRRVAQDVTEILVCYEYFPKGSLHDILFVEQASIDWNIRFKIIKGICEGLKFLHTLHQPIIHLNLKPQNIMLDDSMIPKIADFGYSRIVDPEKSRINTQSSVGSDGYMAPEYVYKEVNEISTRFDIYSLGLIIIEITTREKNCVPGKNQESAREFIDKVTKDVKDIDIMMEYPGIEEDHLPEQMACINIGLRCVQLAQNVRPRIIEIVDELNKGLW